MLLARPARCAFGPQGEKGRRRHTNCLVASACASCLRPARRVSASRPLGRLTALTSAGPRGAGAPQSQAPAREPLAFPAARLRASSFKKAPRPRGRGGRRQGAREERRPRPKSPTAAASGARRGKARRSARRSDQVIAPDGTRAHAASFWGANFRGFTWFCRPPPPPFHCPRHEARTCAAVPAASCNSTHRKACKASRTLGARLEVAPLRSVRCSSRSGTQLLACSDKYLIPGSSLQQSLVC